MNGILTGVNRSVKGILKRAIALLILLPLISYASDAGKVVLTTGTVHISGEVAQLHQVIKEGDIVTTGTNGFLYLKTVDNGFLILRPNSEVRIVNYSIDAKDPTKTKIKFELMNGVVRSISGDAVKLARKNFRFNTPVAAIGVRGTDFTVFSDQSVSRVSVLSGGVVVSGFSDHCQSNGSGPCEGFSSVELFATQQGKLLQITKKQIKPTIISSSGLSPDLLSPPRKDEPSSVSNSVVPVAVSVLTEKAVNVAVSNQVQETQNAAAALDKSIIWGRWSSITGQAPIVNIAEQTNAQSNLIAANEYFAIFQKKSSEWEVPTTGSLGLVMKDGEAYVKDQSLGQISKAKMENGRLLINFSSSTFTTDFDLLTQDERFSMVSQGHVTRDGKLDGNQQFSLPTNMAVSGVVTAEKGGSASYIFQRRLDNNRQAFGITYWSK